MKNVYIAIIFIVTLSSCIRTEWSIELWRQKIENSNLSVYKYDAWGGRDSHIAGYKILDSLERFQQEDVLENHGFSFLKSIPNRDKINALSLLRKTADNKIPVILKSIEYQKFGSLTLKTTKYEINGVSSRKSSLRSYHFKSFKETRDSLIFLSNDSQFVNGKNHERISIPKGNIYLMTSKDNKKVLRITYENIIIPDNNEGNELLEGEIGTRKVISQTIYFAPTEDVNLSEFSDYGIYKPVKSK